jgi:release factor glutamine methyltransferase
VRRATDYLDRHGVDAPRPTAETLLASVLGTDRASIATRDEPLTPSESRAFGRALCRRCSGEPTQHVTGEAGFRRLTLTVRPGVFVPRPETEVVVDRALEAIDAVEGPAVVDVGTGTGAIALAIAQERPDARVWAIDRSPAAVELARHNAVRNGTSIDVLEGDLLAPLDPASTGPLDLVVSNPPYVDPAAVDGLPPEVRADPLDALVGGVEVYEELFRQAAPRLARGSAVVVEIGDDLGAAVRRAALDAGALTAEVFADLAGRDRVVSSWWP